MESHQLINQTSGKQEYYSPFDLVDAARWVMGGSDLDPTSSEQANREIVKAADFYAAPGYTQFVVPEVDPELPTRTYLGKGGLDHQLHGRIWMNHPFGNPENACKPNCTKKVCRKRGYHLGSDMPGNADWINHIIGEYLAGRVTEACVLTYFSSSENWFAPLKKYPVCVIDGRTNYLDPDTLEEVSGVPKGSCVTYLGPNLMRFHEAYSPFGEVKVSVRFLDHAEVRREFLDYFSPLDGYDSYEVDKLFAVWLAAWESAANKLLALEP